MIQALPTHKYSQTADSCGEQDEAQQIASWSKMELTYDPFLTSINAHQAKLESRIDDPISMILIAETCQASEHLGREVLMDSCQVFTSLTGYG